MPRLGNAIVVSVGLLALLVPNGARAQAENAVGLPVGTAAPAVTVEDLDGNAVELGSLVGSRPVLIEFWATWCPVCEELEPSMEEAHRFYGDRVAFLVIGVAVNQSQRSIRRHLERHPSPFRYLWDTRGRATRAFKAPTTSYIVILDGEGTVAYTGVGADQDLVGALNRLVER
ncbi:MAG: TlpA family protein disulfide reductase [Gemmatimonadota bacterium]|nr:TlpA family protein disulfide reductase [Gemmatimonadota bacterium]MDH3369526.1 TlpA family protein disulfide reductase [Gemmatimonadota bacterium]MDH3478271.1 TlpA family protein disulfide reductase [Gemmatimonadota bacterium]MDH3571757.1 TlpA family protein disulfide reductase [Gemmatimonadota bacterium]MDH5551162.1 TlpA family protein disulfide reductase [Gemmatimonadota bacterium]